MFSLSFSFHENIINNQFDKGYNPCILLIANHHIISLDKSKGQFKE